MKQFPRTEVEGISLSRYLIGSNWLLGFSHTGPAADAQIKEKFDAPEKFIPLLEAYLAYGIDTIMAPFGDAPNLVRAIKETEQKTGRGIIMVDTPFIDVSNTKEGYAAAEKKIRECSERGAKICLIHHAAAEKLVDKNEEVLHRLGDYTSMIRDAGMVPGLSAHMPELVVYSDQNNYDVQTYIQIFNCMGFMMQVEIESVGRIIHSAKKPVMTIKPMAAGRCTPYVGLTFSWNAIRDCDMVTVGAGSVSEALEDIEYSFAALEHRYPDIGARSSPVNDQAAFGTK